VRCGYLALKWSELRVARGALAGGTCPACRTACDALRVGERRIQECPGCRRVFEESGEIYVAPPAEQEPPASFERSAAATEAI
jgi:Zn-finger nucleic acid-binding protein